MVYNGGFENQGTNIWDADGWTTNTQSSVSISGFGEYELPFETFDWSTLHLTIELPIPALFFGNKTFENFEWGTFLDIITNSSIFLETFDWSTFNNNWNGINFSGYDTFDWSTFNDIWVAGMDGLFDGGYTYETFDNGW